MSDPRRLLDEGSEASPLLRSLLSAAKRADEPSAQHVATVAAGLAPLLGPVVPPPIVPPPVVPPPVVAGVGSAALASKVVAVVVALGVAGGGVWYMQPRRAPAIVAPEVRSAPAVAPDAAPVEPPAPVEPAAPVEPPAAPAPAPPIAPPKRAPHAAPSKPVDPEAEAALVVAAEAALVRNDAAAALTLTRQHAARFSTGAHAEERDRIAIEALVRLGRTDRAHAAAQRFFTRFPQSIYRARLEGLLR